jgi:hypothetical protein
MCETGDGSLASFKPEIELGEIDDIPELLKTYQELGLGRAIMIDSKDPVTNNTSQELGGYVLPTSKDLEHLVILTSGEITLVQPRSDKPDDISAYRNFHSSSPLSFHHTLSPELFEEGTDGLVHNLYSGRLSSQILLSNRNGPSEELNEKIIDAVNTAFFRRNQRIAGMEDSRKVLLKKSVYGSSYTPIEQQPANPIQQITSDSEEQVLWEDTSGNDFCVIE